ncbi:PAS domain S-box protein [Dyadobacter crusticola]|uniref:PAS domain S-box protein n=1 Tax=Dyadobacter crusticola TaxID=292407 RepID=UPI00068FFF38|nr:PAS domain S-box protein [Dyadobacter crusticola]
MNNRKQWSALPTQVENSQHPAQLPLVEHLPVGICICDQHGTITYFNRKAQELWRNAPKSPLQKFCGSYRLYNSDGSLLPHTSSPVARCLEDEKPIQQWEMIIERPDGSLIHVNASVVPVHDPSGQITGAINCLSDVTLQKTASNALKKDADEMQDYLENATVGLHWVDADGIVKWANQAELNMLGYSKEEYIGHHISEFHAHAHKIDDILTRLKADQALNQYESEMVCKDGSIRTVHISSNVFRVDGKFIHTRCFTVDVTANKQLFLQLQDSEYRYRQLVEGLPAAFYTTDANGYINMFNRAAVDLWGRQPVLGQDLWCGSWKIFRPDGSAMPLDSCPMAVALKEQRPVYGEEIIIERPDGLKKHVLPYPSPTFTSDGHLTGAVNMLVDITVLKQAEQALRESEDRFRNAADTAPVMIWMGETARHRDFFNSCWIQFTGRGAEQQAGTGWMQGIHTDDFDYVENVIDSAFASKSEYKIQYRLRRHTGHYRWVHSQGKPRYTPDGDFAGYIGTVIDIHEQRLRKQVLEKHVQERTRQLRDANDKLERSNKELEGFAYVASHDLQEPLRKIKSLGSLLVERHRDTIGEAGADLIRRMQSASERMGMLIDDLLSFSHVSSAHQKIQVDLQEEVRGVLMDLETAIKEKGADIQVGKLLPVNGYAPQVRQLFQNLISNALKFTVPGRTSVIKVSSQIVRGNQEGLGLSRREGEKRFQMIEVRDNGIGFDQQYADQIFQPFRRLHNRSEFAGTGLGLAIVKKIIENHNGYIKANGIPGEGATFKLFLPE